MADAPGASLDPDILDVLRTQVLGGALVVEERRLSGGFSSDNVLLRTDRGTSFVLRRYPRRNTCAVEAALMRLVADRVPVPEVVYADDGGDLLGEPFILTRFASGVPLTSVFAGAADEDGPQLAEAVAEVLVAIHSVRFGRPGFFSDGALRPDATPPEHHDDLVAFVEATVARGNVAAVLSEAEQRALVELGVRCAPLVAETVDADQLVHSDFNPDIHMTPAEGMQAHLDLQGGTPSGVMLPIHWGTFNLAPHPWAEPGEWTKDAAEEADQAAALPRPGEPFEPAVKLPEEPWWRAVSHQIAYPWRLPRPTEVGAEPRSDDLDLAGER
ncbi:phosphotransferase [Streptomyces sp. 5K101]|uniref:phosphotransferase family protein n=1 Tax=Streptomyces sp. 5K101 TaxID=3390037 RepID=UPI003974AD6B